MEKNRRIKKRRKAENCRSSVTRIYYQQYRFTHMEFFVTLIKGLMLLSVIARLFYDSWIALFCLCPLLLVFFHMEREKKWQKRIEQLQEEFKEALIQIGECMEAGYSIENSFVESFISMEERFGASSDMVQELNVIRQSLKLNVKIEDLLSDFAARSQSEDVKDFAVVFSQAKRGGGNMTSIMKRTIGIIKEKIEVQKEIQIMISGKKYEQRIMSLVPVGVMAYMSFTSEGFFDVLYHNGLGIVIMSICLLAYGIAIGLGEHFTKIEV